MSQEQEFDFVPFDNVAYMDERSRQINEINEDVKTICELTQTLNELIEYQQDGINEITLNVESSKVHVDIAAKNIVLANKFLKKNLKLKFGLFGIGLIALNIPIALILTPIIGTASIGAMIGCTGCGIATSYYAFKS